MGRKNPSARDDEWGGGVKSKKKNLLIDDDEYSIGTELSEESVVQEEKAAPVGGGGGKKKGKKGNLKKERLKDGDEQEQLEEKNVDEEDDEAVMQFMGKKKGKGKDTSNKGNSVFNSSNLGLLGDEDGETKVLDLTQSIDGGSGGSEDDWENVVAFTGRKKPTKSKMGGGKSSFSAAAFGAIGDEDDEVGRDLVSGKLSDDDDEPVIAFSGKKKPSKSGKKCGGGMFTASAFGAIGDEDDGGVVEDLGSGQQSDNEEPLFEFSGKKKPSKSGKKRGGSLFSASSFDGLQDGENNEEAKEKDEDIASITFTGKKKKSSKSLKKNSTDSFNAALLDEETNEDVSVSNLGGETAGDDTSAVDKSDTSVVTFSGKRKSSKKKSSSAFTAHDAGLGDKSSAVVEFDQPTLSASTKELTEVVAETSKNKKKKKKSARTAQEEEDLDKILGELGEVLPRSKPTPTPILMEPYPEEKVQSQPELEDGTGQIFYHRIS